MYTTSTLSKTSQIKDCVSIKAFPQKIVSSQSVIKDPQKFKSSGEKAIVVTMFNSQLLKENQSTKFTYTIKQGDNKRINREGFLRVYNLSVPVDIPVGQLLGKWKETHIGVTLSLINDNWCIQGGLVENPEFEQQPIVQIAFQRLLRFMMA